MQFRFKKCVGTRALLKERSVKPRKETLKKNVINSKQYKQYVIPAMYTKRLELTGTYKRNHVITLINNEGNLITNIADMKDT